MNNVGLWSVTNDDLLYVRLNETNQLELVYVIQDRTLVKNGKRADIYQVLATGISFGMLESVCLGKIPLYYCFTEYKGIYTQGKVGKRLFPKEYITVFDLHKYLSPEFNLLDMPNQYDLVKQLESIPLEFR